jgi:uncharacterized protein YbaR (Trm112 family)
MSDDTETTTLLCPECRELLEIADARAVMLAHHLDNFCPETEGVLHA